MQLYRLLLGVRWGNSSWGAWGAYRCHVFLAFESRRVATCWVFGFPKPRQTPTIPSRLFFWGGVLIGLENHLPGGITEAEVEIDRVIRNARRSDLGADALQICPDEPLREKAGHTMRLVAVDGAGARAEIKSWAFDVTNPKFAINDAWPVPTVFSDGRNVLDKYHVNESYFIKSPGSFWNLTPEEMFVNPAQGSFGGITFGVSAIPVNGADRCLTRTVLMDDVLTQFETGAASIIIPCLGNYTARLTARDLAGTDAVLDTWSFPVLPRDTDVPEYGPNGMPCERSDDAEDEIPMDGSFTCKRTMDPASADSNNSDTTSTVIGGVLGGILIVVLAWLIGLRVHVHMLKHRPVDVGAMQQNIVRRLGLAAIRNVGPLEFGITLTLANAVDVVAGQFRSDLVAALRKAAPKLATNLATATVANAAASVPSAAGANAAAPIARTSHRVLVVISRQQLPRRVAESTVETLVGLVANGKLRIGTNAVVDARIAIPRVVPREVSRQALTRIDLLGEGQHGAVYEYQVHEKNTGVLPYPVAAKTIKATAHNNVSGRHVLLKEAALMALLDHRNIVALVGVVTVPRDVPALVLMALCNGGTLQEHLVKAAGDESGLGLRSRSTTTSASVCRLSVSDRLTLCAEVLQGLGYLSNLRIVHRDVAARNVLLDATGTCKISDFGMSMSLHLDGEETEYAEYVRVHAELAIRWSAIEVLNDHKFSKASDVWAFGVLCWEVFADGRLPYSDEHSGLTDTIVYVKEGGKLPSPSPDCPVEVFNELMLPCWEADSGSRPTARALYDVAVKLGAIEDDVALAERKARRRAKQRTLSIETGRCAAGRWTTDWDRSLRGVSVDHLSRACIPAMLCAIDAIQAGNSHEHQQIFDDLPAAADASIWHMVHAYVKPASEHTVCPRDGNMGCAYVDTLSGEDDVGRSDALLS